ncbi:MMPL family transporter [bacterium]|nr:MMPL family transporter [bacterium]
MAVCLKEKNNVYFCPIIMDSKQFTNILYKFISHKPWALIIAIFAITIFFLLGSLRLEFDPSLKSMVPKQHEFLQTMDEIDNLFGGTTILVLAVESDSLLYDHTLLKYEAFADSLAEIDVIDKVVSLYSATKISSSEDGFQINPLIEQFPKNRAEVDSLKKYLNSTSRVVGNIISADFRMMSFICQLTVSFDYDEQKLVSTIEELVKQFEGPEKIYYAGMPITRANVTTQMHRDMSIFLPVGLVLMILFLAFSFRSWLGVLLPLMVVVISTIWTLGLMGYLGLDLPFTGILIPVMLIAITNNYGIHIISHYYDYSKDDLKASRVQIIKKTLESVSFPIFIAGLTTVLGFLGLLSHILPKARELGIFVAFGIFIAFILSVLLIPAILNIAKRPALLSNPLSFRRINSALINWGKFFIKYNRITIISTIIIMIIAGFGIKLVSVDSNPNNYYKKDAKIRIDNDAISKGFGGTAQISVLIEGNAFDPQVLQNIDLLTEHFKKYPLVSQTASIVDVVKTIHMAFNNGDSTYYVIPDDEELIAQYIFLYSLTDEQSGILVLIDDVDSPENSQLIVRIKEINTNQISTIVEETQEFINTNFVEMGAMKISGGAAMLGTLAQLIVKGQMMSLIISLIIMFIIMSLVFRSVVGGVISIIPLISAIIVVFGFMGYAGIDLDIATAMLSSIMIGVGIDYTVHFLWHVKEHIKEGQDLNSAIFTTLRLSGKGIVFNALSVIIGFSVLLLSVFVPVNFFGLLILLSIGMCLIGALALLPAIISLLKPKFLFK